MASKKFFGSESMKDILTKLKGLFDTKQDKLSTKTPHNNVGSSTQVPVITTDEIGVVTEINPVDISYPIDLPEANKRKRKTKKITIQGTSTSSVNQVSYSIYPGTFNDVYKIVGVKFNSVVVRGQTGMMTCGARNILIRGSGSSSTISLRRKDNFSQIEYTTTFDDTYCPVNSDISVPSNISLIMTSPFQTGGITYTAVSSGQMPSPVQSVGFSLTLECELNEFEDIGPFMLSKNSNDQLGVYLNDEKMYPFAYGPSSPYIFRGVIDGRLVANGDYFILEDGAAYMLFITAYLRKTGAYRGAHALYLTASHGVGAGYGPSTTALAAPKIISMAANGTVGYVCQAISGSDTNTRYYYNFNTNTRENVTLDSKKTVIQLTTTSSVTNYRSAIGLGSCTTDCHVRYSIFKICGSNADFNADNGNVVWS